MARDITLKRTSFQNTKSKPKTFPNLMTNKYILRDELDRDTLDRCADIIDGDKTRKSETLLSRMIFDCFLEGQYSDVVVKAFGSTFSLHRMILAQAPYFKAALSFVQASRSNAADIVNIDTTDIDPYINICSLRLVFMRLYGRPDWEIENKNLFALLATASFLGMASLITECVDKIANRISRRTVSQVLAFAFSQDYGRDVSGRMLDVCKVYLMMNGSNMCPAEWDRIDSKVVAEIVASDSFWAVTNESKVADDTPNSSICGEYARYEFLSDIYSHRLNRLKDIKSWLLANTEKDACGMDDQDVEIAYQSEDDLEPLLEVLHRGIRYCNMTVKQLRIVENPREDLLGRLLVPPRILAHARNISEGLQTHIEAGNPGVPSFEHIAQLEYNFTDNAMPQTSDLMTLSIGNALPQNKIQDFPVPGFNHAINLSALDTPEIPYYFCGETLTCVPVGKRAENSCAINPAPPYQTSKLPPYRASVEIKLPEDEKYFFEKSTMLMSPEFFYAGNWWQIICCKILATQLSISGTYHPGFRTGLQIRRAERRDTKGLEMLEETESATDRRVDRLLYPLQQILCKSSPRATSPKDALANQLSTLTKTKNPSYMSSKFQADTYEDERAEISAYFKLICPAMLGGYHENQIARAVATSKMDVYTSKPRPVQKGARLEWTPVGMFGDGNRAHEDEELFGLVPMEGWCQDPDEEEDAENVVVLNEAWKERQEWRRCLKLNIVIGLHDDSNE